MQCKKNNGGTSSRDLVNGCKILEKYVLFLLKSEKPVWGRRLVLPLCGNGLGTPYLPLTASKHFLSFVQTLDSEPRGFLFSPRFSHQTGTGKTEIPNCNGRTSENKLKRTTFIIKVVPLFLGVFVVVACRSCCKLSTNIKPFYII